ncbi:MAG TPA: hypothetical protein VG365_18650, partial [Solirubrobacteraceae bacterium]|nr:hypothetical protein [Solirubrobacteraceae bacterium]
MTTPFPSPDAIARAELLTRERFVYDGESLEEALAPGSPRRRALDAAIEEVEAGHKVPSIEWRRQFSLLLGLERLLSDDEPHLVDGTVLSAHQVDALSGTLTALLAESQRVNGSSSAANGNGDGSGKADTAAAVVRAAQRTAADAAATAPRNGVHAVAAADDEDDEEDVDDELDDVADEDEAEDDEPQDWQDDADEDERQLEEQPEDPNAAKR